MSKIRYDRDAAAQRTRAGTGTTAARSATPGVVPGAANEYLTLSVWQIESAPWQPRRVFSGLEELAASIEGTSDTEGVGVLEPVLVRRMHDDTYQLIDGERRLRACRLIAERSPARDFQIPARVFRVSERVARLMGQTANLERAEPRPVEVALGYLAIRDALREEIGERAGSLRALVGLGWHEKTQIGDYLKIAAMLTDGTVEAAGLTREAGEPDFERLCRLDKKELDKVAALQELTARAAALRDRVDRRSADGGRRPKDAPTRPAALSPAERRVQITTTAGFALRTKAPAQMLEPSEAGTMVQNELAPAILAMTERAYGGTGREGFFALGAADHVVIVLPTEVEALTTSQLERLAIVLAEIRGRVDRTLRHRRKNSVKRPTA
ncbi:MAG TPA: ParB N-terminal domain-containing protein [Gemmatimonadales bacterium]